MHLFAICFISCSMETCMLCCELCAQSVCECVCVRLFDCNRCYVIVALISIRIHWAQNHRIATHNRCSYPIHDKILCSFLQIRKLPHNYIECEQILICVRRTVHYNRLAKEKKMLHRFDWCPCECFVYLCIAHVMYVIWFGRCANLWSQQW